MPFSAAPSFASSFLDTLLLRSILLGCVFLIMPTEPHLSDARCDITITSHSVLVQRRLQLRIAPPSSAASPCKLQCMHPYELSRRHAL